MHLGRGRPITRDRETRHELDGMIANNTFALADLLLGWNIISDRWVNKGGVDEPNDICRATSPLVSSCFIIE